MLPNPDLAPFVLTAGDTACRPGCMYHELPDAPPHSHWQQADPSPSGRSEGWFWRLLFRIYGDATPAR